MKKKALFILPALLLSSCSGKYDFNRATGFMAYPGADAMKHEYYKDSQNFKEYAKYANEIYKQSEECTTTIPFETEFLRDSKFFIHFSFYPGEKERVVSLYFYPQNEIIYIFDRGNYGQADNPTRQTEDKEEKYYLIFSELNSKYFESKE